MTSVKKNVNSRDDISFYQILESLEEKGGHAILSWSFIRLHGKECSSDLFLLNWFSQISIHLLSYGVWNII